MASFLQAFGAALPERVVPNAELAARARKTAEWIAQVSGIEERRWAAPQQSLADLATEAALDCLRNARVEPQAVSMVMVASGSAEQRFPGPAVMVAHQIGATGAPAIDLPMASAGALFGMALAERLTGAYENILVIGAEKMSAVVDREPFDPATGILFGDGAGACLVSARSGAWRVVDSVLHSDGTAAAILRLPLEGPLEMSGMQVILQAQRKFPAVVSELLARNNLTPQQVDHFIPHQANQNLIVRVAKSLNVEAERFVSNIRLRGNTSSASMLIAAAEAQLTGNVACFSAFGAGLHWGALLAVRDS